MKKPPKPSTLKALDFETSIRASKAYLRTRVYQDGVGEQVAELLGEFFTLWCRNIAFPELALPVVVMLRRWLKEVSPWSNGSANGASGNRGQQNGKGGRKGPKPDDTGKGNRNAKVNGQIVLLVQKLEANSRFIEERRAKVEFAPNDRAGVEGFLKEYESGKTPLGAFAEGQRKQREERRRVIEQGRKDEERRSAREEKDQKNQKEIVEDGFEGSDDDVPAADDDDDDDGDGLRRELEAEREVEAEEEDEEEIEMDEEDERELDDDEIEMIES